MFWADKIVEEFINDRKETIDSKKSIIIRDEKTASGRMLISAMRGAVIHGIIAEIFSEGDMPHTFLWEINDTDAFRNIPESLDKKRYQKYLGMPLYSLPSPVEGAENYPEYFAKEFNDVMNYLGFTPLYYRSSTAYKEGKFNDVIRTALLNAELVRKIYKEVSGSEKPSDWLPLMVVCEKCGKIGTTQVIAFDGEKVTYRCKTDTVEWAEGCGHKGDVSPFNGNATLPWKVEWAAKFKVFNVDIEGGGKDLSTKGGARDVSNHIVREVFNHQPPFDIPYEFFLSEGKKMSTSKGNAPAAHDVMSILPPHIYRLVFLGKNYKQAIEFNLKGDTVPILFDTYDRLAQKYHNGVNDDDTRLFSFVHKPGDQKNIKERFLPRFSQVVFLIQMPHINIEEAVTHIKGAPLTEDDKKELEERVVYAREWIEKYAPERYVFKLQLDKVPDGVENFSSTQREALGKVLEEIKKMKELDGQELHTILHNIRKELDIEPKDFFGALYLSFLGKESGPKAGWFLSVLDKEFLKSRLEEVSC